MIKIFIVILIIIILVIIYHTFELNSNYTDQFINITNPFVDGLSQFQLGTIQPDSNSILNNSNNSYNSYDLYNSYNTSSNLIDKINFFNNSIN